jgi:hypothetical protein
VPLFYFSINASEQWYITIGKQCIDSIGQCFVITIAICLKEKKENKIKKEKKVWEESCFQESKSVPVTPIVFLP